MEIISREDTRIIRSACRNQRFINGAADKRVRNVGGMLRW